jgi:hypothetical protein
MIRFGGGTFMEIHKPKPWHGGRELLKEVGTIVLGVLIALAAEQAVETLHWRHKVAILEGSIRGELSNDLGLASEQKALHPCLVRYLDTLQGAVLSKDAATIQALSRAGPPLPGRAWPRDTWTAALNIAERAVTAYSRAFLRIGVQREFMQEMEDQFPVALSGGFGLQQDVSVTNGQLVAIQRLHSLEARRLMISNSLLSEDGPAVSVSPATQYADEIAAEVRACEATLSGLGTVSRSKGG